MHARERTAALAYAGAAMGVVFAGDLLTFFVPGRSRRSPAPS
jgi:hypothetical protein